jgi:2-iminobutanoate/2-iminopropanoate deaminase
MPSWSPVNDPGIPGVPGVPTSHLPFSPAVCAGGFVFVSGQASVDDTGQIVSGTFEQEMRRAFHNTERILAACGLTLGNVVQVRNYLASQENLKEFNDIYRTIFQPPYPARTTIMNCLGRDFIKFEVEVVAYGGRDE